MKLDISEVQTKILPFLCAHPEQYLKHSIDPVTMEHKVTLQAGD